MESILACNQDISLATLVAWLARSISGKQVARSIRAITLSLPNVTWVMSSQVHYSHIITTIYGCPSSTLGI